jgi:hypothetical protein
MTFKKKSWLLKDFIGPVKLSPMELIGILAVLGGAAYLFMLLL